MNERIQSVKTDQTATLRGLLTSGARTEILTQLVFAPGEERAIRELDRCVQADYRAVWSELRRLHAAGYVARRKQGRAVHYRFDLAGPGSPSLAALVLTATGTLQRLARHVEEALPGRPAILWISPGAPAVYRLVLEKVIPLPPPEIGRIPPLELQSWEQLGELGPGDLLLTLGTAPIQGLIGGAASAARSPRRRHGSGAGVMRSGAKPRPGKARRRKKERESAEPTPAPKPAGKTRAPRRGLRDDGLEWEQPARRPRRRNRRD